MQNVFTKEKQARFILIFPMFLRWFALMEIHLYVATVLKMLDISLLDPVPHPVCVSAF